MKLEAGERSRSPPSVFGQNIIDIVKEDLRGHVTPTRLEKGADYWRWIRSLERHDGSLTARAHMRATMAAP